MIPMRTLGVARRGVAALGATVGAFGLFDLPYARGTHLWLGLAVLGSAVLPFSRRFEAQLLARALWLQVLLVSALRVLWGSGRELGPALATAVVLSASLAVLGLDRLTTDERSPLLRLPRFRVSAAFGALLASMQAVSSAWLGALQLERFGTFNVAILLSALFALSALALMRARTVGLALSAVTSGSATILAASSLDASPAFAMPLGLAVAQLAALMPLWRAVGVCLVRGDDALAEDGTYSTAQHDRTGVDRFARIATGSSDPAPDLDDLERSVTQPSVRSHPVHS
jgi:hypothetical protein